MMRVAMMAGTLHPKPMTMGMKDLPCKPILCISLSMMKAARDIYPESSIKEIKKYRIRMLGRKTRTLPAPAMRPFTTRSFSQPSVMMAPTPSPNLPTSHSIQSIGYCPKEKVAWKITYRNRMKMGKASQRFVTSASILSVQVLRGRSAM